MIGIVDYGLGNVQAFLNIYDRLQIHAEAVATPEQLNKAERLILPGVGAFDWAMERLDASGLRVPLERLVLEQHRPILGVCVGLQMMCRASDEGRRPGLGWIPAEVRKIPGQGKGLRLPHMGWNNVQPANSTGLMRSIADPVFYFLHSYIVIPDEDDYVLATATYGHTFTAAAGRDHIAGTQFHPEKSHEAGVQVLKNFSVV